MGEVAGVHDERRPVGECVDLADRLAERLLDHGVGRAGEPDVAVADLHEPQGVRVVGGGRWRITAAELADHLAARDGQHHGAAEPRGVAQQLAPGHAVFLLLFLLLFGHGVTTTVAVMNGWMVHR